MEQLPGNSHNQRREQRDDKPKKEIQRVVQGEVVARKRPFHKRFAETFFAARADTVGEIVFWEVLVPAAKNMFADAWSSFGNSMVFGQSGRGRATSLPPGQSVGAYGNRTPYHNVGQVAAQTAQTVMSQRGRARHDFKEIVFGTRVEAETVLDELYNNIALYNAVTVSDFYDLCGYSTAFTDDKYGWTDIRGSGVLGVRNGFVIDLPSPVLLD